MRRWHDKKIIANHFVEWHGTGVKSVKSGFARAVEVAKLDLSDGKVTPHTPATRRRPGSCSWALIHRKRRVISACR
jgi:hypothetical protein